VREKGYVEGEGVGEGNRLGAGRVRVYNEVWDEVRG
jgi:hypothetical protein